LQSAFVQVQQVSKDNIQHP